MESLTLRPVTTADTPIYNYVEELLVASFPSEEYRPLDELRRLTDEEPRFCVRVALEGDAPVGLITVWSFPGYAYIEHFAIDPNRRNGGYGARVLRVLAEELRTALVLEVELLETDLARRRIGFYERQGFTLWNVPYQQPPYRPGDGYLPMRLMVRGDLQCNRDYETIRRTLHREVYHVTD